MSAIVVLYFLLLPSLNSAEISELISRFNKVADFTLNHYEEINFDGLLGFVIAEAQILEAIRLELSYTIASSLKILLNKCETIRRKISPILPKTPLKMIILEKSLLDPNQWITGSTFFKDSLENLGIYQNWTVDDIVKDKSASYKGVLSDHCLMEILGQNCYVSDFCKEMMLSPRIDKGYLLTHRLFYLQIVRLKKCSYNKTTFEKLTNKFCSWIFRETRTNDFLGFPSHDIALEQMVLSGMEGYAEFLNENWKKEILSWQTPFGCYRNINYINLKRSSNVISFGCKDHTSGLGAAAIALHLRYEIYQLHNSKNKK